MRAISTSIVLGVCFLLTTSFAQARKPSRGWVPAPAWEAVKQRARADLGTQNVKLHKSFWSKRVSRRLVSAGGKDAYIVHAKTKGEGFKPWQHKRKGVYLVQKSRQGIYEAYPVGPNGRQKHLSTINARKDSTTAVMADGAFPASKIVHGLKVKNAARVSARLGQIVASKPGWFGTRTVFLLGSPNKDGIGAAAQLQTQPTGNVFYNNAAARVNLESGRPIMPPNPNRTTHHNVQYHQLLR